MNWKKWNKMCPEYCFLRGTVYCVLCTVNCVLCTVCCACLLLQSLCLQVTELDFSCKTPVVSFQISGCGENGKWNWLYSLQSLFSLILDSLKSLLTLQFKSNSSVRKILFWRKWKCYYNSPFNLLFLFSDIFQTYSFDD